MDIDKIGDMVKSRFDINKVYEKYRSVLKGAEEGKVVTRFPPEPSGFLHIGHVKALFLNYHYSKIFKGKMILRFDDTNPAKEKQEYTDNIKADIKTLGVEPDMTTYTSDYFQLIADKCRWMLENGLAYCDNTPVDAMRKERFDGIASKCRDVAPEENIKIWDKMLLGDPSVREYCVRAKMSVDNPNKCMRDPTIYRFKDEHHERTGTKWKVYPTYDFACPIVDSQEGVTHAMRSSEYADRIPQYEWFLKKLNLNKVRIFEFSRLNFVSTIISKRHLGWFVLNGLVDGWNDPRFPTVQGIMRRGLLLPTLIEFMLDQGPSKNNNLMEWDKIWAINKNYMEPIAGKYTAVSCEKVCTINIGSFGDQLEVMEIPVHQKNDELGKRPLFKKNKVYIDFDDAETIKEGDKVTLMKWGNIQVKSKTQQGDGSYIFEADYLPNDEDFKNTAKITWLAADDSLLAKVNFVEYDHLIDCPKLEEDEKLEDHINKNSRLTTTVWADPFVKQLPIGAYIQFERRSYCRVDRKYIDKEGNQVMDLIFIPDGKSKGMSNLKTKVDAAKFAKGTDEVKETKKEKAAAAAAKDAEKNPVAPGEEGEKKPKGPKVIDEAVKAQKMKEKADKLAAQKATGGDQKVADTDQKASE